MRFQHKKTGVVVSVLGDRAIEAYKRGRMWEPVADKPIVVETIPADTASREVDWESMTKNELVIELVNRGIEFNKRQPKAELIDLLRG